MKKTLIFVIMATAALCLVATNVSLTIAALPNHGAISLAFDDSLQSQYEYAFPLLRSRGMVGTFYVVSDYIRGFSQDGTSMSIAQLQRLQDYGNEIGSHSKTHRDFFSLTDEQIQDECSVSKQVLEYYGLTVNNFAYPYGDTNDHIDSIVSQYYRSGRKAYTTRIPQPIQFSLAAANGVDRTGDANVLAHLKNIVDQVYSTHGWTIVFFHNIVPDVTNTSTIDGSISTEDFTDFLDYIISNGVQTLTVNQALSLPTLTLTMATDCGTVSPASEQYIEGTKIRISASPPISGPGERYVWLGWTGSGEGSYTGLDNPTTVTMNFSISQAASWRHEYYLNVTSPYADLSGQDWYDAGETAHASLATGTVSGGMGIRHVFTGWSGDASGEDLTSNAMTMNDSKTAIANWKTQYYLEVNDGGHGAASGEGWYDSGSSAAFSINSTSIYEGLGARYVFTHWSGNYTSNTSSDNILMNEPKTVTANWKAQYEVTLGGNGLDSTAYGTVVTVDNSSKTLSDLPFSMWVDSGSMVTYNYVDVVASNVPGMRFELGSATGQPVSTMTISGATSVTASYKTQYLITFNELHVGSDSSGIFVTVDDENYDRGDLSFWWDRNSSHRFAFTSQLAADADKRYVYFSTVGLSTEQTGSITTLAPGTLTADYKIQYYLNVDSPWGVTDGAGWYGSGATAYVTLTESIVTPSSGVRYVFAGWSGDASGTALTSNPIIVDRSMSAVASWKKQFLVVFDQTGLKDGFEAYVALNPVNQTLPYPIWINEGDTVEFSYLAALPAGFSQQYLLTSLSTKSPLKVESPITVTGHYTFQDGTEFYFVIAIPAVLVAVAIGIVFLKTRQRPGLKSSIVQARAEAHRLRKHWEKLVDRSINLMNDLSKEDSERVGKFLKKLMNEKLGVKGKILLKALEKIGIL